MYQIWGHGTSVLDHAFGRFSFSQCRIKCTSLVINDSISYGKRSIESFNKQIFFKYPAYKILRTRGNFKLCYNRDMVGQLLSAASVILQKLIMSHRERESPRERALSSFVILWVFFVYLFSFLLLLIIFNWPCPEKPPQS